MGKAIAGMGKLPYDVGGFCVPFANIKGEIKTNLNIFRQRSYNIFDLIDVDKNVFKFIKITYVDKNGYELISSTNDSELASTIGPNTFFIKSNESFVISFHYNKLKLVNGGFIYHPWELYYCNVPGTDTVLPNMQLSSYRVIQSPDMIADNISIGIIEIILKDDDGNPISGYDISKIKPYLLSSSDYNGNPASEYITILNVVEIGNGVYRSGIKSSIRCNGYIECTIDGIVPSSFGMIFSFD